MIKANFNIDNLLKGKIDFMIEKLVDTFVFVGERCVSEARDKGSYTDRTANLRASTGYVVLYNGIVQRKSTLIKESEKLLEELIPKYKNGIVLIVVAGMNYAAYVEAKNYNVLTSAELLAENLVPRMLKKLGFKI